MDCASSWNGIMINPDVKRGTERHQVVDLTQWYTWLVMRTTSTRLDGMSWGDPSSSYVHRWSSPGRDNCCARVPNDLEDAIVESPNDSLCGDV